MPDTHLFKFFTRQQPADSWTETVQYSTNTTAHVLNVTFDRLGVWHATAEVRNGVSDKTTASEIKVESNSWRF